MLQHYGVTVDDDLPMDVNHVPLRVQSRGDPPVARARASRAAPGMGHDLRTTQGSGHSCGIHTALPERARALAAELDVVRVLVNQAHTFANGGSFDNGLPFTLSMGCGTWAGNSISENLNWRHFINITHLVTTIPEDRPSEEALFGPYWAKYGK